MEGGREKRVGGERIVRESNREGGSTRTSKSALGQKHSSKLNRGLVLQADINKSKAPTLQ